MQGRVQDDPTSLPDIGEGDEEEESAAGAGNAQERVRKRDMYKIRSLLLQVRDRTVICFFGRGMTDVACLVGCDAWFLMWLRLTYLPGMFDDRKTLIFILCSVGKLPQGSHAPNSIPTRLLYSYSTITRLSCLH